jgi:hypothetical protein
MVTPQASRPAALSQRQVDDLARGQHEELAPLLHAVRVTPPTAAGAARKSAAKATSAAGSAPVALSAKDMQGIAGSGSTPARIAQRIAASRPAPTTEQPAKAKAAGGKPAGAAPKLRPPGC